VANQRAEQKRWMSPTHRERLDAVSGWVWSSYATDREQAFRRLASHAEQTGTVAVTATYVDEDGFKLGSWANTQKKSYRAGKLDPERARQLEGLPGWKWGKSRA
jgi:hypothetical protein